MATQKKRAEKKKEYSKIVTSWCRYIVTAFILFVCFESHRLGDLSAIESVAGIIKYIAVVSIGGYFYKARSENQIKLQIEYQKQASELKKMYGDDYVTETLEFDNLMDR